MAKRKAYKPGSSGHVPGKVPKKGTTIKWGRKPKGLVCVAGDPKSTAGDPNFSKKAKR